jgi:hypothetical protein
MKLLQTLLLMLVIPLAWAVPSGQYLKPFVLAETRSSLLSAAKSHVVEKLTADQWKIVADYQPYKGTHVVIATHPELQRLAQTTVKDNADSKGALFFLPQRIALTETPAGVQISYTNPYYFMHAYRLDGPVDTVADSLRQALGWKEEFGSEKGLSKSKLRGYKYAFGMEYFTDLLSLARYSDHKTALKAVEAALKAGKGGTRKVYRIDVPGREASVFGVQLNAGVGSDKFIIDTVDINPLKHTAYMPYEMVVEGGEVYALHPRFRIALHFPDTRMAGEHSFMKMIRSPDSVSEALVNAAGGDYQDGSVGGFQDN